MGKLPGEAGVDVLAAAAETAVIRARDLLSWWHSTQSPAMFDLEPPTNGVRIRGFFDTLRLQGKTTSVMGVLQTSEFRARPGAPARSLGAWVGRSFLRDACWRDSSGNHRGFRYTTRLVQEIGKRARAAGDNEEFTLADIGIRYDTAVLRLDLLDYGRAFPPAMRLFGLLDRFSAESAYLVFHSMFSTCPHPAPAGSRPDACFGYSFAPLQIRPSIQGYGPGRFHSALKQYRFFRMADGAVCIEVCFVVAPRTERILKIFGLDPVYGTASVLDRVTFNRASPWAHVAMDRFALRHHGRVHRDLLEGMRHIWEGSAWSDVADTEGVTGS